MTNFNRVILMGRLTRDPNLVYTPVNFPICKFRLAVNRSCKDQRTGQWKKEADYFNVDVGGPRGEAFAKYHTKGSLAFVSGELRYHQWDDKKTAMKREAVSVWVDDWQFVEALSPVPVPQQIEDEDGPIIEEPYISHNDILSDMDPQPINDNWEYDLSDVDSREEGWTDEDLDNY
jgi:single stranded DNA-binding protein